MLSYGNTIDLDVNQKILAIHHAVSANPFPGFIESVPAYASIAVFYDTVFIRQQYDDTNSVFDFVKERLTKLAEEIGSVAKSKNDRLIKVPVNYNGVDLAYMASIHNLTVDEVIKLHVETVYHIYMNGFLPGFAYMGTVNEKIATARKVQPRLKVRAGSVGIAGTQTGIYPFDSPGGWQIIGTTPLKIFDKTNDDPCLLKAGDSVQFFAIDKNEFDQLNEY